MGGVQRQGHKNYSTDFDRFNMNGKNYFYCRSHFKEGRSFEEQFC